MSLEIAIDRVVGGAESPTAVVGLVGELDAANYLEVIDAGRRLYEDGIRRLVLDLSGLTFIASSGLVALHSLILIMAGEAPPDPENGWAAFHTLAHDVTGGPQTAVQLCGIGPAVDRVLVRTGMGRLFLVHPDRAAALAAG
jgi:anti-anti-sigma regulatory factor